MRNRMVLLLALAPLTGSPPAVRMEGEPKRITVWLSQELPAYRAAVEGFRAYLESRGYSVALSYKSLESPQPAVRATGSPDLILAIGSPAALAAGSAPVSSPVIALTMKRAELRSTGAMTGVVLEFPVETELGWIKRLFPRAKRIGVVYNPIENGVVIERAASAARGLGLELVARPVRSRDRLADVLASLQNDAEVLWSVPDTLVLTPETARSFLLFEFRQRIPFIGLSETWVRAGALSALGRDWDDLGRQCGELAEQVFRGKDAGTLEPQFPRRVLYFLNRNTAEVLRIEISPEALKVAKEIAR